MFRLVHAIIALFLFILLIRIAITAIKLLLLAGIIFLIFNAARKR